MLPGDADQRGHEERDREVLRQVKPLFGEAPGPGQTERRESEEGGGRSPVGARALLNAGGRTQVRQVSVGESIMGQHSTTLHFGLGPTEKVDSIEIHWPGGETQTLLNPDINRYHRVVPGGPRSAP